jgi:hypothetical protein
MMPPPNDEQAFALLRREYTARVFLTKLLWILTVLTLAVTAGVSINQRSLFVPGVFVWLFFFILYDVFALGVRMTIVKIDGVLRKEQKEISDHMTAHAEMFLSLRSQIMQVVEAINRKEEGKPIKVPEDRQYPPEPIPDPLCQCPQCVKRRTEAKQQAQS